MRDIIRELIRLGPIPSYSEATSEILDQYSDLLESIEKPVTDEEAKELIILFSPDDAGDLNYAIIHLVETSPNWPLQDFLTNQPNSEFVEVLINRAKRGGLWK